MPKGVMLTHDNMTYYMQTALKDALKDYEEYPGQMTTGEERIISYLPLSHVAAQFTDLVSPLFYNMTVHFAKPDALSGSLIDTLKEVRPTIFMAVPRIYEKMEEKMKAIAASVGPVARAISTWAKKKGTQNSLNIQNKEQSPFGYSLA